MSPPEFKVSSKVWLLRNELINNKKGKLAPKKSSPFTILKKISDVSYKLKLPNFFRIFPVFHISLLEPAYENEFKGRNIPTPKPIILNGEKEYKVESILDSKKFYNKIKYLIHWKGYDDSENSWEPFENLHCNKFLAEFYKKYPN